MAQRKTGNVRLAPDGNMMRDASSPGGTLVGTQTYGDTPEKKHKAWLFNIQEDARAAAGHRKLNSQAVKNARKKAKREEKTGKRPANLPLYAHWLRAFPSSRLLAWDRSEPSCKRRSPRNCAEQSRLLRNEMLETPGRRLTSR